MVEKEINEGVDPMLRMSWYMAFGLHVQLQLTCNHPTSRVFFEWTIRLLIFLGLPINAFMGMHKECRENPNLAGLPCEESATFGARKALGLSWGGRPEDDQSGLEIARRAFAVLEV